ncbi:MAG: helix-turn-helix domain-containing protein, partial [Clostridia bacterium]|nr:helix-turn-helix domain-containing protein [Clostridia bacterium]
MKELQIGSRLRELRKKAGLTQSELAETLHVTEQSVSRWETDASAPDIALLPVLAALLGTSADYLLTGKEVVRYVPLSPYDLCRTEKTVSAPRTERESTTYNGIAAEKDFPPKDMQKIKDYGVLPVPYLKKPPEVIDITLGRQLFVDDFLIQKSTFVRQFHQPQKYGGNPIFCPETPLEKGLDGHSAMAAPFSDGVFYDGKEQIFKMWYHAGWFDGTAYAESRDGIHFTRVATGKDGSNRVIPVREGGMRDSCAVVLDRYTDDPMPYKRFLLVRPGGGEIWESADGKHFEKICGTGGTGDRSTVFYNPFRKKWVYSMRTDFGPSCPLRARSYVEADTLADGASLENPVFWQRADRLDPVIPSIGDTPSLYNLDCIAYESVLLGAFTVFCGPENNVSENTGIPKHTELHFGFSRDGFHFSRPDCRIPAIAPNREDPNSFERGYIHSNNGICVVNGDELWFYYTSFKGDETKAGKIAPAKHGMYANASMSLAKLRRDGFASLNAGGYTARLLTRPLCFTGNCLLVNGDFHNGLLRLGVTDDN